MLLVSRPESLGVICGMVYLICMFLFIPMPFVSKWMTDDDITSFPHHEVISAIFASNLLYELFHNLNHWETLSVS